LAVFSASGYAAGHATHVRLLHRRRPPRVESAEREGARTARLHDFLDSLPGRASSLYIMGDLFDFWFEYRTAIPRRHFGTLARLSKLRDAGVDIAYLNGNHDFWLGTFFRDSLGIRTVDGRSAWKPRVAASGCTTATA
jgi:hypothetical protein